MEPKQVRGLAGVHSRCPKLSMGPADPLRLTSEQAGLGDSQKAPCCCCLEKPLSQSLQKCDQGKTQKRAWCIHSNQQQFLLNFYGVFSLGFLFLFFQLSRLVFSGFLCLKSSHLIRAAVKVEVGICRVCPLAGVLNGQKPMGLPQTPPSTFPGINFSLLCKQQSLVNATLSFMCKFKICFHDDLGTQQPAVFSQWSHTLVPDAEGTGQASSRPLGWGGGFGRKTGNKGVRESRRESVQPLTHHLLSVSNLEECPTEQTSSSCTSRPLPLPPPLPRHPFLPPPHPSVSYHALQPVQPYRGQMRAQHSPFRIAAQIPQSPPPPGPSHSSTSHTASAVPQCFAHLYAWPQNSKP